MLILPLDVSVRAKGSIRSFRRSLAAPSAFALKEGRAVRLNFGGSLNGPLACLENLTLTASIRCFNAVTLCASPAGGAALPLVVRRFRSIAEAASMPCRAVLRAAS